MKKLLKNILCVMCGGLFVFGTAAFAACGNTDQPDDKEGSVTDNGGTPNTDVGTGDNDGGTNNDNTGNAGYTESNVYGNEYIVYHDEGATVEYVFEAECTNLENKSGNTYSGDASGSDMAKSGGSDASNGGVVGYLYNYGNSVNFIVVSDREVEDATLVLRCGAEFNNTTLNANTLTVRVDPVVDEDKNIGPEAFLTHYQDGGFWGKWDQFLDYFNMDFDDMDNYNFNGQYITAFDCGSISIQADGVMNVTGIADFVITAKLHLYEGVNSISFITNNNTIPANTETQRATAVVIDCIKITTTAQLGLYNPQNNGYGTDNACTVKTVED